MSHHFVLSSNGRIATVIAISLAHSSALWAEGITPAEGSGVQVSNAPSGVPVVSIATPSAAGLSHNRFNDYNIGSHGAVLNNATAAGTSVLAGALGANAQLQGQAAQVILNEVVTRNPSLLLGKQEIFGQAADFVLANPNGITCNGCGFINTPRASLLVGTVQLSDGRLQSMQAGNEGASLTFGTGGIMGNDVLDLIAPRIDAQGKLVAVSGLNVILGNARVDYASNRARVGKAPAKALDSALLGGMQAGRISIISTDDGAGVNLSGTIQGQSLVKVMARGKLELEAAQVSSDRILLSADEVRAHARREQNVAETANHDESWFIWQTGAADTVRHDSQTVLERAHLEGKLVRINARGEIGLSATDIVARNIRLRGRDISLAGELDLQSHSTDHAAWKNSWSRQQYTEQETQRQIGSSLDARHNLNLVARRDIRLEGAKLKVGNDAQLVAGQDVKLSGLVDKERSVDRGRRYLEGDGLASGSWNKADGQERINPTELTVGGVIAISATNDLSMQAAKLTAGGDIAMSAGHDIHVLTQGLNQDQAQRNQAKLWGGLAGSDHQNDRQTKLQNVASQVHSGGVLSLQADHDIRIVGSQLKGEQGARALAQQGRVGLEHASDLTQSLIDLRTGGAFDIPTHRKRGNTQEEQVQGTQLASNTNLEVVSGNDMEVSGSRLDANRSLNLSAGGNLSVHAAEQSLHELTERSDLKVGTYAGRDPKQADTYRVGVDVTRHSHTLKRDQITNVGASLTGRSVQAKAAGDVSLKGSRMAAQEGDLVLSGRSLTLAATTDQQQREETDLIAGGGMYLSASRKQLRLGAKTAGTREHVNHHSRQDQGNQLSSSGNMTLDAGSGSLLNQGGVMSAGGALVVQAGEINNQAIHGEVDEQRDNLQWDLDIGVNADPGVLLKPLGKVADKLKSGKFTEAMADAGKIKDAVKSGIDKVRQGDWSGVKDLAKSIGMPTVGAGMTLAVGRQTSDTREQQATGNQFSGQQVHVHSGGALNDQASVYQANAGKVAIKAKALQFAAAQTHSRQAEHGVSVDLALQGSTSTGQDLALKGKIGGSGNRRLQTGSKALTGAMSGQNGVEIQVEQDAAFDGGRLDGGQGALSIKSGGDLTFDSAHERHSERGGKLSAALELELNMTPNADKVHEFGGAGKLNWDGRHHTRQSDTAVAAQLSGQGGLALQAGKNLTLRASQLGGGAERPRIGEIALSAGGSFNIQAASQSSGHRTLDSTGDIGVEAQLKKLPGANVAVKGNLDYAEQDQALQARIDADRVVLFSAGDTRLTGGVIETDTLSGRVGGNLQLESVKERERTQQTNVDVGLATPDLNKIMSGEGFTVRGKVQHKTRRVDAVQRPSRIRAQQQSTLSVAGKASVNGAQLESGNHGFSMPGQHVEQQTIKGQHDSAHWGGDFDGTPSALAIQTVKDLVAGKKPLGIEFERLSEDRSQPGSVDTL